MTDQDSTKTNVKREASRIEEDCKLSSKSHFNAASGWKYIHYVIGIPTVVLAAIASGSAFNEYGTMAGYIGIVVTALTALATFIDPTGRKTAHKGVGNQYLSLRNRTRIFREIEIDGMEVESIISRMNELSSQRDNLNETSPGVPAWAFKKAKTGIASGEADYEIDQ